MIKINLTKKQATDLASILFVGISTFKDKRNKDLAEELHNIITEQYLKEVFK
jgi:hypothetical protein